MSVQQIIKTPRLRLVRASVEMARAAADSDHARFAQLIDAFVPPDWPPPIMADAQEALVTQIAATESGGGGLAWYVVLRQKHQLIGFAGFKGAPKDGRIDIGYAILDAHQRQGYATEAVKVLSNWAFIDPRVQRVVAETLPDLIASIRVVEKCGFRLANRDTTGYSGEENVVQYELKREDVFGS